MLAGLGSQAIAFAERGIEFAPFFKAVVIGLGCGDGFEFGRGATGLEGRFEDVIAEGLAIFGGGEFGHRLREKADGGPVGLELGIEAVVQTLEEVLVVPFVARPVGGVEFDDDVGHREGFFALVAIEVGCTSLDEGCAAGLIVVPREVAALGVAGVAFDNGGQFGGFDVVQRVDALESPRQLPLRMGRFAGEGLLEALVVFSVVTGELARGV